MSQTNPNNSDVVLGGQTPPPVNAAILGGVAGAKQQIAKEWGLSDELVDRLSHNHKIFRFETVQTNDRGEIVRCIKKHAFYYTENLGEGVDLDMIYIPAGSFMMGISEDSIARNLADVQRFHQSETPQHLVNISAFYMSKYPITQEQYQSITGENPSSFQGSNLPVEQVTWNKAKEYCQKLVDRTNKPYVLPSESQWEYACRAGTTTLFCFGDIINTDLANYNGKFSYENYPLGINRKQTTEVDKFPPNSFGIYDVHGNVSQWCADTYHGNYEGAPIDERPWVDDLPSWSFGDYDYHMLRGGCWHVGVGGCHSAMRMRGSQIPSVVGCRVACLTD